MKLTLKFNKNQVAQVVLKPKSVGYLLSGIFSFYYKNYHGFSIAEG